MDFVFHREPFRLVLLPTLFLEACECEGCEDCSTFIGFSWLVWVVGVSFPPKD